MPSHAIPRVTRFGWTTLLFAAALLGSSCGASTYGDTSAGASGSAQAVKADTIVGVMFPGDGPARDRLVKLSRDSGRRGFVMDQAWVVNPDDPQNQWRYGMAQNLCELQKDFNVILRINYAPWQTIPPDNASLDVYKRYLQELVPILDAECPKHGVNNAMWIFKIGNEPNIGRECLFSGVPSSQGCGAEHYAKVFVNSRAAVHDPLANIPNVAGRILFMTGAVSPGKSANPQHPEWGAWEDGFTWYGQAIDHIKRMGGADAIDALGVHVYGFDPARGDMVMFDEVMQGYLRVFEQHQVKDRLLIVDEINRVTYLNRTPGVDETLLTKQFLGDSYDYLTNKVGGAGWKIGAALWYKYAVGQDEDTPNYSMAQDSFKNVWDAFAWHWTSANHPSALAGATFSDSAPYTAQEAQPPAPAPEPPPPPPAGGGLSKEDQDIKDHCCPQAQAGNDNICQLPDRDKASCWATRPNGYCDPDGDGQINNGSAPDWGRGWSDFKRICLGQ